MAKTIVGLYDDFGTAQEVVEELVDAEFPRENISIVANDASGQYGNQLGTTTDTTDEGMGGAGTGAGIGAVLGGVGGLLVGLGALAIPGIGPVIAAGPLVSALVSAGVGAGVGALAGGLVGALVDVGVPEEEAGYYAEGVRRGGALVTVNTADDRVAEALSIMEDYDPVDIEQRASEWQQSGWSGFDATRTTPASTPETSMRDRNLYDTSTGNTGPADLEVVEEELQVGKRAIDRGGVRIRSYVTEKPVEATVRLREEQVNVERRPVNRPADADDLDAFEEGVIEVTAIAEEPVVAKQARVVEEVVVNKDVQEREETIQDTVRRKDVEVENVGSTHMGQRSYEAGTGDIGHTANRAWEETKDTARSAWQETKEAVGLAPEDDYSTYDTRFRQHYNTNYANTGYDYNYYSPAYRYGYNLANNAGYRDRSWAEIEPDIQRSWEERNQGTWERFKDSIRHGWEETKRAVGAK
ncbi:MAG: YsnF/AvaK domain-containing protein [Anaerolineae bacterium]